MALPTMQPKLSFIGRIKSGNVLPSISTTGPLSVRSFTTTTACLKSTAKPRQRFRDPYAIAQAAARKAANLSKQSELREKRTQALGDPIRGISTPFVESFDTATPLQDEITIASESRLNHFLTQTDIDTAQKRSVDLAIPPEEEYAAYLKRKQELRTPRSEAEEMIMPSFMSSKAERETTVFETRETQRKAGDLIAARAIGKIVSLDAGNSKDRTRTNIQRCIEKFGRHQTDKVLPPKPAARLPVPGAQENAPSETVRVGPDTGSSEVQIAILTAKIRALADFLETRGKGDMVNKRNLRLLVHRRQKLLRYLRRKERGGPRWTHVIETLGLTEGTWKGEISL